jgi:hypothetical protein
MCMERMLAVGFSKVSIVHKKDANGWFSKVSIVHGQDASCSFFKSVYCALKGCLLLVLLKCLLCMERMIADGFSKVSNVHGKDASCWFF